MYQYVRLHTMEEAIAQEFRVAHYFLGRHFGQQSLIHIADSDSLN
jgi:hypothetical protein